VNPPSARSLTLVNESDLTLATNHPDRKLSFEGAFNFRDLGGYETASGRSVKWRRIFRSGTMGRLTAADRVHLGQLGIRAVVDFRTATEQAAEPNAWCREENIAYWSRAHNETFGNLHEMVERGFESADHARTVMLDGFRQLPFQQGEAYGELFRRIAAGQVPIAFNCTAGKDRTGGAAALVLDVLGVPRQAIAADFELTERAVDFRKAFLSRPSTEASRYASIPEEIASAIRGARPEYVLAMLEAIDERFGSVTDYLLSYGVSPGEIAAVRSELLE